MRPLAVVGNVNVDLIMGPTQPWPVPGTEVTVEHDDLRVGGAAGNAALAWMGLGADFVIASSTGDDAFGQWLAAPFGEKAAGWPRHRTRTTISVGLTHPNTERTFFTTTGHLPIVTWADIRPQLESQPLRGGLLLLCGSFVMQALAEDYSALFDWAHARDIDVALDMGWPLGGWTRPQRDETKTWLGRTKHLLVNEIEAMGLTGTQTIEAAAEALAGLLPDGGTAIVKTGARGAMSPTRQGLLQAVAPSVRVIDTIGAGDVFNAGYLLAISKGAELADAMQAGVTTASLAISTAPRRYSLQVEPLEPVL